MIVLGILAVLYWKSFAVQGYAWIIWVLSGAWTLVSAAIRPRYFWNEFFDDAKDRLIRDKCLHFAGLCDEGVDSRGVC